MKKLNFRKIIIAAHFGLALTAVLLFVSAVLLYFTDIPEKYTDVFVWVSSLAGIFFAGIISSLREPSFGWLRGGISGVIYALVLCVIRRFFPGGEIVLKTAADILIAFLAGSIGGITGINIKFRKKRN